MLWTGPKHSGKTSGLANLVEVLRCAGLNVAGLLAPSLYREGVLVGFDAVDVRTGQRAALLRLPADGAGADVGAFAFSEEGVALGRGALAREATDEADLVVVDEFGPLELRGGGWRSQIDALTKRKGGTILLVVRTELLQEVGRLYAHLNCTAVTAGGEFPAEALLSLSGMFGGGVKRPSAGRAKKGRA